MATQARSWLVGIVCAAALALSATGDTSEAIACLGAEDDTERTAAVLALARGGDEARIALQVLLHPASAQPPAEPDATQRAEIAALIAKLSSSTYSEREAATGALLALGKVVTVQLREATRAADLEVRARAQAVLDRLYPQPSQEDTDAGRRARVEAALLLAELGTRASVPALTHALETGDEHVSAAAAYALRAVLGGGPSDVVSEWAAGRKELLAAWKTRLADAKVPAGEPGELALRHEMGQAWTGKAETRVEVVLDMTKMLAAAGRPGVAMPPIARTFATRAEWRGTVTQAAPPALALSIDELEEKEEEGGGAMFKGAFPGMGLGEADPAWKGKTLTARPSEGVLLFDGARSRAGASSRQLLALILLLASRLPEGRYAPGEARALSAEDVDAIGAWVLGPADGGATWSIAGSRARLTYLGRDGDRDRYWLQARFHRTSSEKEAPLRQSSRSYLQGEISIDPAAGHVCKLELSGPTIQAGLGPHFTIGGLGDARPELRVQVHARYDRGPAATAETTAPPKDEAGSDR